MKATTIVAAIVVIIVAVGAWYIFMQDGETDQNTTPSPSSTPSPSTPSVSGPAECNGVVADGTLTINYANSEFTADGVQSNTFCVKKGSTVTFTGDNLWAASDPHPVHTDVSGFDANGVKSTYSFKFDQVGEHGFHNHFRASDTGTIIVVE